MKSKTKSPSGQRAATLTSTRSKARAPREAQRDDDRRSEGLEALTVKKLRELAGCHRIDVRGLRLKQQLIDKLRTEGLARLEWRKASLVMPKDPDPPDGSDPWALLEYLTSPSWGRNNLFQLNNFAPEHREVVAASLGLLIADGSVCSIPATWSPAKWDDYDVQFMVTEEGWERADRQAVRDVRRAAEHLADAAGEDTSEVLNLPKLHREIMNMLDHADRPLTREQVLDRSSPSNRLEPDERPFARRVRKHAKNQRTVSIAINKLISLGFAHEPFGKHKGVSITPKGRTYQDRCRQRKQRQSAGSAQGTPLH